MWKFLKRIYSKTKEFRMHSEKKDECDNCFNRNCFQKPKNHFRTRKKQFTLYLYFQRSILLYFKKRRKKTQFDFTKVKLPPLGCPLVYTNLLAKCHVAFEILLISAVWAMSTDASVADGGAFLLLTGATLALLHPRERYIESARQSTPL